MANVSDWKGFEKMVAEVLDGKRRLRTMESYGKEASDVYFPKKMRKRHPKLKTVAIECKKRKAMNLHAFFADARTKYCKDGKHLILASKIPVKGDLESEKARIKDAAWTTYERRLAKAFAKYKRGTMPSARLKKLKRRLRKKRQESVNISIARLRARHDISPLVTVELEFFQELWRHWLYCIKEDPRGARRQEG